MKWATKVQIRKFKKSHITPKVPKAPKKVAASKTFRNKKRAEARKAKRFITPQEHLRRSQAAKKGWIKRRLHLAPKVMNRSSCAINGIPMHGQYASAILQAFDWDVDFLADLKQQLIDKLVECVEKYLGYLESEWWFSYEINYEYPHEIGAYDSKLDNSWRFYVEKDGRIVSSRMGLLRYL